MNILKKNFPDLSKESIEKIETLKDKILEVNREINIISRKDEENIMLHHILPALAIYKYIKFEKGSEVLDIGSGGGLPGLPLAIIQPEAKFTLIDSRSKKCEAMTRILEAMKLQNVEIQQARSNELKDKFDYVIGRGVADPESFIRLAQKNLSSSKNEQIFYISGGEKVDYLKTRAISDYYKESYFREKYIYIR